MTEQQRITIDEITRDLQAQFRTWFAVKGPNVVGAMRIEYGPVMSDGTEQQPIGSYTITPDGTAVKSWHY